MKFSREIEVDDLIMKVLLDCNNGILIDSQYIIQNGFEANEYELDEYLEGGFYKHYPLSPTPLGYFIIKLFLNPIS